MSPALAVAEQCIAKGDTILFVGSKNGIEKKLANEAGLKYAEISTGKLRRYFSFKNFTDPFRALRGYMQAKKILKKFKPDTVFASGGFVSLPVGLAAKKLQIPLVLNEADLYPGLSNKILAKYADKICIAFPDAKKNLPKEKTILTGLPLQKKTLSGKKSRLQKIIKFPKNKPVLVILGGSQGASFLNNLVSENLPEILKNFSVIHLTGRGKADEIKAKKNYLPLEYVDSQTMADIYATADIAIARAGSNTLFELSAWKIPSIIIPLPSAAADHQSKNAAYFKKECGFEVLAQKSASGKKLINLLKKYKTATARKSAQKKIKIEAKEGLKKVMKVIRNLI